MAAGSGPINVAASRIGHLTETYVNERRHHPARSCRNKSAAWLAFVLAIALCSIEVLADEWQWSGVDRVVAISDVHGAYDGMEATLRSAGILDDELNWAAGETHLVITGDLLDRGPDSRKVMDLIMNLEPQASAAGGFVHLLLGNHEVMNLVGDLRYVSSGEYAAFSADESPEGRERWFQIYLDQQMVVIDEEALRAEFNENRPPGFFGHRRAFRSDGKYGEWLLGKPLMIVIDGTAYVHGGLSPLVATIGLDGVNGKMKSDLVTYVEQLDILYDAGVLDPAESFYKHKSVLESVAPTDDSSLTAAINSVIGMSDGPIHASDSPLWYRGNVSCGPLIEVDRIDLALQAIGAHRVVIGHTPTLTRRVLSRLYGKVIEIDTGMNQASYRGSGNALIVQGDKLTVINEGGPEVLAVVEHPRRVGLRAESVSAEDLQNILLNGSLVSVEKIDREHSAVKLNHEGIIVEAVFAKNPRSKDFVPELAAYRLDRLLDLDMVPVTVRREIDGDSGTLQFRPSSLVDETERTAGVAGGSPMCPLPDQWEAMYVFDALIYNPGRIPEQMFYNPGNWQLILASHDKTFGAYRKIPPYLNEALVNIGSTWQKNLMALSDDVLEENFSDVLGGRRLKSLAGRRDEILDLAKKPAEQ